MNPFIQFEANSQGLDLGFVCQPRTDGSRTGVSFAFHLGTEVPKSDGRVDVHRIQAAGGLAQRFQSVMVWSHVI